MVWVREREYQLSGLVRKGYSASQIAAKMGGGLTRNAVIGKVERMGLTLGGATKKQPQPKPEPVLRPKPEPVLRPRAPQLRRDNYRARPSRKETKTPPMTPEHIKTLVAMSPDPVDMSDINPYAEVEKMARLIWKD